MFDILKIQKSNNLFIKILFPFILTGTILFFSSLIYFVFNNQNTIEYYSDGQLIQKQTPFTTIIQKNSWNNYSPELHEELLVNKSVSGSFIAKNNNLGIVAIPFNTYGKISSDKLTFRIREKAENSWHFQGNYDVNQFQHNVPFPFGFPIIKNSKDTVYYFEIESLKGSPGNAVSISNEKYYIIKYKYSKSQLLQNKTELIDFIVNKIITQSSLLTTKTILISLFVFLVTFIFSFSLYKITNYLNQKQKLKIIKFYKATKAVFFTFIHNHVLTILLTLLLIIVGTDKFYNNLYLSTQPTEAITRGFPSRSFPSNDFYTSIYFRAEQMIHGKVMDISVIAPGEVDASGPLLPLLFSPFLAFLNPDRFIAYFSYLAVVIIAFILFFIILMKKTDKTTFFAGLIFLIAFLLSEPGYLGIFQGNIDILLSPLAGIFIIFTLYFMEKKSISIYQSILLGIVAGSLINIKITIFPLILSTILFSRRLVIISMTSIITFLSLLYIPNFYGSGSTLMSHFSKILAWRGVHPLDQQFWANHSLYVIASFFSGCFESNTCETQSTNTLIAFFLFLFTFITPFLLIKPINRIIITKGLFSSILKIIWNKEFALILFTLSVAISNLPFKIVYDYRLYFSVVVTLIVLKETANIKSALIYCYLSMFSLLLGGIWALRLASNEFGTIDPRLLKIFFFIPLLFSHPFSAYELERDS